jgi:hypothetical protein
MTSDQNSLTRFFPTCSTTEGFPMKVTTTIGWNATWLRNVVAYCCNEIEYPFERMTAATFTRCHNAPFRGRSWHQDRSIRVKLNPVNVYPLIRREPRSMLSVALIDPVELLVLATAREIADLERREWRTQYFRPPGKRDGKRGREKERAARRVLAAFRAKRSEVLQSLGGDPGEGPVAPAVVHRLTCRTCGKQRAFAVRPAHATTRDCELCQSDRREENAEEVTLAYDRVPFAEWSKPAAPSQDDDENYMGLYALFSDGVTPAETST